MPSVLFVCVANSFRSQMAEAFARSLAGAGWEVASAGSHPSGQVHPLAVELLAEAGLSLAGHRSKSVAEMAGRPWDYVVTMGCGDNCPIVPARQRLDWDLPDPSGLSPDGARLVRDRIRDLVRQLIDSHPTVPLP